LLKSLGADHVFNSRDSDAPAQIRTATNDSVKYALDCISFENTAAYCAGAISSKGGHYTSLLSLKSFPREDVTNASTLAYTATAEEFKLGETTIPATPEHREFAKKWWKESMELLGEGKLKVHPPKIGNDGLKGVLEGLELLKADKVSGEKLVYTL
jgi:NADPH:quinone reductase-like Zn-dependent oxidoreductase